MVHSWVLPCPPQLFSTLYFLWFYFLARREPRVAPAARAVTHLTTYTIE